MIPVPPCYAMAHLPNFTSWSTQVCGTTKIAVSADFRTLDLLTPMVKFQLNESKIIMEKSHRIHGAGIVAYVVPIENQLNISEYTIQWIFTQMRRMSGLFAVPTLL